MHETRPTRVHAHREQDGFWCVYFFIFSLYINGAPHKTPIGALEFLLLLLLLFPTRRRRRPRHRRKRLFLPSVLRWLFFSSLSLTLSLYAGFIMFGFVGFFVKLVLWVRFIFYFFLSLFPYSRMSSVFCVTLLRLCDEAAKRTDTSGKCSSSLSFLCPSRNKTRSIPINNIILSS